MSLTHDYVPTDLAAISPRHCACAQVPSNCIVMSAKLRAPSLDRIIGTPFGNRLRALFFTSVVKCCRFIFWPVRARVSPFRALVLPKNELGGVSFYEALARARPELAYLAFSWSETTEDSHSQQHARF